MHPSPALLAILKHIQFRPIVREIATSVEGLFKSVFLYDYCLVKHFAQARNTSVESLSALGCEKSELSLPPLLGMRIRKRQREETECFTKW